MEYKFVMYATPETANKWAKNKERNLEITVTYKQLGHFTFEFTFIDNNIKGSFSTFSEYQNARKKYLQKNHISDNMV